MEKTGEMLMSFIEAQTGTYFGADDSIKYDDSYSSGRGAWVKVGSSH